MSKNTLVVVFAGANGSGKSSITREISSSENFPQLYINADEIARSLPIEKYTSELSRNKLAAEGGHDVPEKSIRDRYLCSMNLQAIVLEISVDVTVYDNSIDNSAPTVVVEKQDDTLNFPVESWAKRHYVDLIRER